MTSVTINAVSSPPRAPGRRMFLTALLGGLGTTLLVSARAVAARGAQAAPTLLGALAGTFFAHVVLISSEWVLQKGLDRRFEEVGAPEPGTEVWEQRETGLVLWQTSGADPKTGEPVKFFAAQGSDGSIFSFVQRAAAALHLSLVALSEELNDAQAAARLLMPHRDAHDDYTEVDSTGDISFESTTYYAPDDGRVVIEFDARTSPPVQRVKGSSRNVSYTYLLEVLDSHVVSFAGSEASAPLSA